MKKIYIKIHYRVVLETLSENINQFGTMVSELWADLWSKLFWYQCILGSACPDYLTIISWFIIHKNGEITRTWTIIISISTSFDLTMFFLWWIIKKVTKREGQGTPLKFFYEVYILVLTDIIALLLTPGIFSPVDNDIGLIACKLVQFSSSAGPPEES